MGDGVSFANRWRFCSYQDVKHRWRGFDRFVTKICWKTLQYIYWGCNGLRMNVSCILRSSVKLEEAITKIFQVDSWKCYVWAHALAECRLCKASEMLLYPAEARQLATSSCQPYLLCLLVYLSWYGKWWYAGVF